mgnify:CR=1 FL=1
MARKKKEVLENVDSGGWPKINQGSHLTVKTFEDGSTELIWDHEALLNEVKEAILSVEEKTNQVLADNHLVEKANEFLSKHPTNSTELDNIVEQFKEIVKPAEQSLSEKKHELKSSINDFTSEQTALEKSMNCVMGVLVG